MPAPTSVSSAPKNPADADEDQSLALIQAQLRSESEWMRLFPGKINLILRLPNAGHSKFNGQSLNFNVESRSTIGLLKD
jgi:hypothetical protein